MVRHENDDQNRSAIEKLRKKIIDGINAANSDSAIFHHLDMKRIEEDRWIENFLIFHDNNVETAFEQCWETLEWRKKFNVNDISEKSVKQEDLVNGNIYIRGRDIDGKHVMFFRIRMYSRGSRTIEDLQTYFLYWVERGLRLTKGDQMTLVLDMQGAGIKNMDLEYTKMMISIFKNYYPNSMNFMLVFEMPFLMNGIFQIIKGLLPRKVLDRMKFVNSKTAKYYIEKIYQPREWGGLDDYELKFIPEEEQSDEEYVANNNNSSSQLDQNLNSMLGEKKVHFAAYQENSPMSEVASDHFGDMLILSPAETIIFQKTTLNSNEYAGNVEITNVSKKPITYKVKTTAPDKFRVRPSSGTLSPSSSATINVIIQKGQALPINKDKFLVMCMSLPEGLTNDEITNLWKEVSANSEVEQHRLKCAIQSTINNNDMLEEGDYFIDNNTTASAHHNLTSSSGAIHNGTKLTVSPSHLQATVHHLSNTMNSMQQEIKSLKSLQWISMFVFFVLAVSITYILKMEIQNQNSQYCIDK